MVDLARYLAKIECHGYNRGQIFWTEKNQTLVSYPVFIHVDLIHFQIIFLKVPQVTILKNISSFQENLVNLISGSHWLVGSEKAPDWLGRQQIRINVVFYLEEINLCLCLLDGFIPHNSVHFKGTFLSRLPNKLNLYHVT